MRVPNLFISQYVQEMIILIQGIYLAGNSMQQNNFRIIFSICYI